MKTYKVALTRTYLVSIKAETKELAKIFSEFYLGDCADLSTKKEQLEKKFLIKNIELVYNEANEIMNNEPR
ncbi:MAG: hypothetical protein ABR911_01040 [Syntrophales bacterium]|jgi:hypothetical protein